MNRSEMREQAFILLFEKEFFDGLTDFLLGKIKIEKNKEYFYCY